MPDGVYVTGEDGRPSFVPAPQLADDDVQQIVETTAKRVVRLLVLRQGPGICCVFAQGHLSPQMGPEGGATPDWRRHRIVNIGCLRSGRLAGVERAAVADL